MRTTQWEPSFSQGQRESKKDSEAWVCGRCGGKVVRRGRVLVCIKKCGPVATAAE